MKELLHVFSGEELEYLRPNVYRNVARQLNITVASESIVSDAFLAVAADIFSTGRSGPPPANPQPTNLNWRKFDLFWKFLCISLRMRNLKSY